MIEKRCNLDKLIDQGDIYKNIKLFRNIQVGNEDFFVDEVEFEYVVVLSQTCDLRRIYDKNPNSVLSVLVAPLFLLEEFKKGKYLEFLGIKTQEIKDKSLQPYINNEKPRFYVLNLDENEKLNNSLLDSFIIDFKYFFTADMSQFNERNYVSSIKSFYREELSHNFANYLSRIGIPTISKKEEKLKNETNI